jgi:hypothetical protein
MEEQSKSKAEAVRCFDAANKLPRVHTEVLICVKPGEKEAGLAAGLLVRPFSGATAASW